MLLDDELEGQTAMEEAARTEKSLWLLSVDNPVRKVCSDLAANPWFDRIILTCVIVNAILMACYDPKQSSTSTRNKAVEIGESIFTVIFFFEAAIKIMALTFYSHVNSGCYWWDHWNKLDFVVVIAGIVSLVGGGGSELAFVRVLRILRPLRTLKRLPGLRLMLEVLFENREEQLLRDSILVIVFFLTIQSIVSLHVWMGKLRYRCFSDDL